MTTPTALATQVYQVFIKTSPERIWEAITTPDFTRRYFHGSAVTASADSYVSRGPDGEIWMDEEIYVFDPPRKLSHSWRSLYDPTIAHEQASRVTWEIEPQPDGVCKLTVTHDRLEDSPKTAESVSGAGWMFVISGLKTLLETGEPLASASAGTGG
ncbi:MAG TPA: SRPBCC family protein [Streptosporangiaceae bacterium]|jgi:uncharacterized protein YndB with AHSA1/START domain